MPASSSDTRLLFVYNADTGLFNTMADIGHKIFAPSTYQCDLCKLTHGYFSERREWRDFVESLPLTCEFLHRDQFRQAFPTIDLALPAVFLQQGTQPRLCISARSLTDCHNLDDLKNLIELACRDGLDQE